MSIGKYLVASAEEVMKNSMSLEILFQMEMLLMYF